MAFGGYLQANTAVDLMVGPFVDEDNGKTAETGLTITQAEVRLSKNGANMAQKNEGTSLTHDELGNYVCKLDTTDTNTEGILTLMIHESGALPIKMDYMVLAQAAYISHVTAKDAGFIDVNIKTIGRTDTTETQADNLESACGNYSVTRGLTGTALPAAVADAAGGVPVSDAGGLDIDTKLANTNEITVARMGALTDWINGGRLDLLLDAIPTTAMRGTDNAALASVLGAAVGASISADIAAVKAETATIVTDTNEVQGKLPTNKFMGSSDGADDDGNINSILTDTNELQGLISASKINAQVKGMDANVLTATAINADAITNAKIADNAFAVEQFANDFLTAAKIATGAIAADAVAATALDNIVMSDLATGAPSATASIVTAINVLYEAFRNKTTTTATLVTIKKDDGSTDLMKSTISDDATTFTKNEFVSG